MREELRIALTEDHDKVRRISNGGTPIFKIKIRYKSGASEEFWTKSFEVNGSDWTWAAIGNGNRPIKMGVDHIESVWQTDFDVLTDEETKEFLEGTIS